MPKYLAANEVHHAVKQLGRSSAKARMCEFLIGVRTLTLMNADEAQVAESIPEFLQAVDEWTRWVPEAVAEVLSNPYYNPFGSQAAYKYRRYPSNGPSNTMHGWATQSDSPFGINADTRPKSISRRTISVAQLRRFLLNRGKEAERPRLIDTAVWFYRNVDLEGQHGSAPDRAALEAQFVADVGLTNDEVTALFRLEADDTDGDIAPMEAAEREATQVTNEDATALETETDA